MRVADVGWSRREAARYSMRIAGVGRSMYRFLKYIGLTGVSWGSMWCWQLGHVESRKRSD